MYKNGLDRQAPIMDGMARSATKIVLKHRNFDRQLPTGLQRSGVEGHIRRGPDRTGSRRSPSPSVIITTAGMLNGGPVDGLHNQAEPAIQGYCISGYQVEGTNGSTLLESAARCGWTETSGRSPCEGLPPRPVGTCGQGGAVRFRQGLWRKNSYLRPRRPRGTAINDGGGPQARRLRRPRPKGRRDYKTGMKPEVPETEL
jgi:hypothetical protein